MTASPREGRLAGAGVGPRPIAVTMGDPAGIGLDITLMSWHQRVRHGLPAFVLYADPDALSMRARALGLEVPLAIVASPKETAASFTDALPVLPVSGSSGDAAIVSAIELGTAAVASGEALALVTNPI